MKARFALVPCWRSPRRSRRRLPDFPSRTFAGADLFYVRSSSDIVTDKGRSAI